MAVTSGSSDEISGTVAPSPLLYCVVIKIGIDKIFARRTSSCAFLTSISLLKMGGSSFCWMSTTIKAHCSASSGRRATSVESVENATVPITDDIELPPRYELMFILACCLSSARARHRNFAAGEHVSRTCVAKLTLHSGNQYNPISVRASERVPCGRIAAPSFNGRTADSGSAYLGSNPWGAAKSFQQLPLTPSRTQHLPFASGLRIVAELFGHL